MNTLVIDTDDSTAGFTLAGMFGVPEHEGRPVFEVVPVREDRQGNLTVAFPCPYCGTLHSHGMSLRDSEPSHRSAHCTSAGSPLACGGYYLRLLLSNDHARRFSEHQYAGALTLLRVAMAALETGGDVLTAQRRVRNAATFLRGGTSVARLRGEHSVYSNPHEDARRLLRGVLQAVEGGKNKKEVLRRLDAIVDLLRPIDAV